MDGEIRLMPLRTKPAASPAAMALRAVADAIEAGERGDPTQIELAIVTRGDTGVFVSGSTSGEALGAYFLLGLGQRKIEGGAAK